MNELVSIVMPMHNAAMYLEEAISSVISQTYKDWELIVVEDNSTDNSLEIVQRMAAVETRIRVIVNDNPTGFPASPRNIAVEAARGRYIAFLDSDDVWLPDKLEQQMRFFTSNANAAVVFSDYEKIDAHSHRNNRVVKAPLIVTYKRLLLGNVIANLTAVYDTSLVGKVYFKQVRHEDYAMWLSILKRGFVAYNTGTVTALYRVAEGSVSSNKKRLLSWQWNIYRKVEGYGVFLSAYYYINYAVRGLLKSLK